MKFRPLSFSSRCVITERKRGPLLIYNRESFSMCTRLTVFALLYRAALSEDANVSVTVKPGRATYVLNATNTGARKASAR